MNHLIQIPKPGTRHLFFKGDTCTFTFIVDSSLLSLVQVSDLNQPTEEKGSAWIRTNIGHAAIIRDEIIREVLYDEAISGRDWFDIPMREVRSEEVRSEKCEMKNGESTSHYSLPTSHFQITLPLCEVGHFEAKCFFLKENDVNPIWAEGGNTVINVEPADTCSANIIYNAFVRQFGPNKDGRFFSDPAIKDFIKSLDKLGYAVIPPSGKFRDLIKELDFIIKKLGCRYIQLLPINPTPTTYGKMGRFGSPYAAMSFRGVDPALAEFDPKSTPLEQFIELVNEIHALNGKILIDIAINHTGWAARLHETHPEWLVRGKDGKIEMPGAWGVVWEDLTRLDYSHKGLWEHIVKVFLTWCNRGVDGFRCDAGYMIPVPAWRYIIARVRNEYPDTIFFLEGLGGKISVTRELLDIAGFNWAYSELFQNYDRSQIENYLPGALEIAKEQGIMIHFAETHDNNRLASGSKTFAKMRTALCALCSPMGGFAFANGVEWYATEKIDVHDASSLNWGAEDNQVEHIQRLNNILKSHPAFHDKTELKLIQHGGGNCIVLLRHHIPTDKKLLIVANLDDKNPTTASWSKTNQTNQTYIDLITEKEITCTESATGLISCLLEPGQVLCLSQEQKDLRGLGNPVGLPLSDRIVGQSLCAKALDVFRFYNGTCDLGDFNPDDAALKLAENPVEFCRSINPFSEESRVIIWQWDRDIKREVMIPPDYFLLVRSPYPFRAKIIADKKLSFSKKLSFFGGLRTLSHEIALPCSDGTFFALFSPLPVPEKHLSCSLKISVFQKSEDQKKLSFSEKLSFLSKQLTAPLLYLSHHQDIIVKNRFHRSELLNKPHLFLATNGHGAMLRAHVSWGELHSRYDALLAANLNPDFPEDRRIMFTRCRAWIVFQGYSSEIKNDSLHTFHTDENSCGIWEYHPLTGQGEHISLIIQMQMIPGKNAIKMRFIRSQESEKKLSFSKKLSFLSTANSQQLTANNEVRLILRPDIEDRNFHETTKAFLGPEHHWRNAVTRHPDGFTFAPDLNRNLDIRIVGSSLRLEPTFVWEPEWHYMINRDSDGERGLDPSSDLFSPGYFSAYLKEGDAVELTAEVRSQESEKKLSFSKKLSFLSTANSQQLLTANSLPPSVLDHFVVRREKLSTVIAGYPWFLDWGRDTLIFVRGLIAVGRLEESRDILKQFARFEKDGTLPNMIRGNDAGNRDTSDAPLWFFAACSDLIEAEKNESFLDEICGDRTLCDILISMGNSLIKGTPNGIRMDPESGLIFSPSHYTWMDTNFPAGTPREGYPIEIQALWYKALRFLETISRSHALRGQDFGSLAEQIQQSILKYFFLDSGGHALLSPPYVGSSLRLEPTLVQVSDLNRYLSDCLHCRPGQSAKDAIPDDDLRPNQLFAITMGAVTDKTISRSILSACEELLVPGAIRTLADRPVKYPVEIIHHGLVHDPYHPYHGIYTGDEDTRRKPAYHNGTAWTWVFPSFCEAWVQTYGEKSKQTALAWLASSSRIINEGCVGHIPEILDGDFPHTQRGCDAQAWGASEWLRVWMRIKNS